MEVARRIVVCLFSFFGVLVIFSLRTNLSIAIVSMTTKRNITTPLNGTVEQEADFNWDSKQRGFLLSSFFYGYVALQLFGGWFSTKYGGATVLGIGIGMTGLTTLFTPIAAHFSFYTALSCRILAGAFEGISYPCFVSIISKWAPKQETTIMTSMIFSGASFGVIVSSPIYGLIAQYFNWSWLFYTSGVVAIIWTVFWFYIIHDDPQSDPSISEKELKYIEGGLQASNSSSIKLSSCPWIPMITSKCVWAIIFCHFAEAWGVFTLLTLLPTVLTDIWKFEIKDAGYLTAIPFCATFALHLICGLIADYLRRKKISTTLVRKSMNSIGTFIPGTIFFFVTSMKSPYIAIALFTIGHGCCPLSTVTLFSNYVDIARHYSGILFGISSTIACTSGIIAPIVAGYIVTNKRRSEWQIMFLITGIIHYVAGVMYLIFASSETQEWAKIKESEKKYNKDNILQVEESDLHY